MHEPGIPQVRDLERPVCLRDSDARRAPSVRDGLVVAYVLVAALHQAPRAVRGVVLVCVIRAGGVRHVVADAVGEVCGVDAGIRPASYAVCHAEGDIAALPDPADEEGVLAAVGARPLVSPPREDAVVGVEGEDVFVGVVSAVLSGEGGCNTVGELCG